MEPASPAQTSAQQEHFETRWTADSGQDSLQGSRFDSQPGEAALGFGSQAAEAALDFEVRPDRGLKAQICWIRIQLPVVDSGAQVASLGVQSGSRPIARTRSNSHALP